MRLYVRLGLVLLLLFAVPATLVIAMIVLERQQHDNAGQRVLAYAEVLANQLRQHQQWLTERQLLADLLKNSIDQLIGHESRNLK